MNTIEEEKHVKNDSDKIIEKLSSVEDHLTTINESLIKILEQKGKSKGVRKNGKKSKKKKAKKDKKDKKKKKKRKRKRKETEEERKKRKKKKKKRKTKENSKQNKNDTIKNKTSCLPFCEKIKQRRETRNKRLRENMQGRISNIRVSFQGRKNEIMKSHNARESRVIIKNSILNRGTVQRTFRRMESLLQELRADLYERSYGLPKFFNLGHECEFFKGEVRTIRLFTLCARLSATMYWPHPDQQDETIAKLLSDENIGLGDHYFKKDRFEEHKELSYFVYDEEFMCEDTLKKLRKKNDLMYSVVVSTSGYMIVTYRGTSTARNWAKNLESKLIVANFLKEDEEEYHDGNESEESEEHHNETSSRSRAYQFLARKATKKVKTEKTSQIHAGFYDTFRDGRDEIVDMMKKHANNPNNPAPLKTIIFTGHSLGGALATMAFAWFKSHKDYNHIDMELITFGQPKCGDIKFKKRFEHLSKDSKLTKYGRFVFKQDLVPTIPSAPSQITRRWLGWTDSRPVDEESLETKSSSKNIGKTLGASGIWSNLSNLDAYIHVTPVSHILTTKEEEAKKEVDKLLKKKSERLARLSTSQIPVSNAKISSESESRSKNWRVSNHSIKFINRLPNMSGNSKKQKSNWRVANNSIQFINKLPKKKPELKKQDSFKSSFRQILHEKRLKLQARIRKRIKFDHGQRHVDENDFQHVKFGKAEEKDPVVRKLGLEDHSINCYMEKLIDQFEPKLKKHHEHETFLQFHEEMCKMEKDIQLQKNMAKKDSKKLLTFSR